MKKIIIVVILLCAIAGVIGWIYHKHHQERESVMMLYGNVDIREVNLGFRVAGRLAKLVYDEGDKVKGGDVIAKLDDEPYRNQVASARAQVESLRERLKLREKGNRPQEIAQARSLVRERKAFAANARRLFQRSENTLAIKGISAQERDNAEAAYREAEARFTSARENLALLEAGFRVEDIAQAGADLAQAEAALASAELQVKDAVLIAPSNGAILTRAQEAGAILQAGTTVFTVSLQNPVWVRAYVPEPSLGRIHPGAKVEIYTDSRPDKSYRGQIGYISPRAEFTPKTVETPELRTALVYRLRIVVENPDEGLRQGMPVTIKLAGN
ncbi:MAG: secretion protein HlyD [Methylobacter sp.]|nr:secretion protein HlyD [Methylobacter sp.]